MNKILMPFGWPNTRVAGAGGLVGGDHCDPVEADRREREAAAKLSAKQAAADELKNDTKESE